MTSRLDCKQQETKHRRMKRPGCSVGINKIATGTSQRFDQIKLPSGEAVGVQSSGGRQIRGHFAPLAKMHTHVSLSTTSGSTLWRVGAHLATHASQIPSAAATYGASSMLRNHDALIAPPDKKHR